LTEPAAARNGLRHWMGRILGDTLARRIFLLLWITLVAAQLLAIMAVQWMEGWNMPLTHVPVAPTLPPMAQIGGPGPQGPMGGNGLRGLNDSNGPQGQNDTSGAQGPSSRPGQNGPMRDGGGPPEFRNQDFQDVPIPGTGPDFMERGPGFMDRDRDRLRDRGPFRGLSNKALMLDYGIRLLVTALAAWLASRWLAKPMRELVQASRALGQSLHKQDRLPLLDEHRGTLEVRETAQVFNAMARQLRRQFNERGLMVAAISHDLRTPLTRLRMRLETLDIEEQQRVRSVEDIHEMNALVDAVMELFRGDSPGAVEDMQDLDLGALAQSMVDDLAEQGQAVSFEMKGEAVVARGQPMALRRVLGNLIGNALRYGGQADVHVGRDGRGAWVHVCDKGPGIPPDKIEAVFEPFYRLEDSRNRHTGGVGLGLYIARELTQRQGGELSLTNRPSGGLMAELRLP
jgi:signal transduction histidine kinase